MKSLAESPLKAAPLVVSNTSPISNLCAIGKIEILAALYGSVIIPEVVRDELHASPPRIKPLAIAAEKQGIVRVSSEYSMETAMLLRPTLDASESAAIALTLASNADFLLLDERLGRNVAKQANINILGIMGVLLEAKSMRLLPEIAPCLNNLIHHAGFRIAPSLVREVLHRAGETNHFR